MPRLYSPVVGKARGSRQRNGRLRDVVAGIILDPPSKFLALLGRAMRSDQHAIPARFADRLYYVILQIVTDVLPLRLVTHQKCLDVVQNWFFAEVVTDDLRHESIDGLIVGHPGSESIREYDIPCAVGVE